MDEGKSVIFEVPFSHDHFNIINDVNVMKDDRLSSSSSSSLSIGIDSSTSSSYDTSDDDASSDECDSSNTSSSYDLSELMAQLPIKRGLSKFYQGKSQSFTSLSRVESVENLVKKQTPYSTRRKMKACKSYGGGLDTYKSHSALVPKPIISKKNYTRGSYFTTRKSNFATPMVSFQQK